MMKRTFPLRIIVEGSKNYKKYGKGVCYVIVSTEKFVVGFVYPQKNISEFRNFSSFDWMEEYEFLSLVRKITNY